jgi:ribosomal protein L37E
MPKHTATVFIECRRCGHKGQREVAQLPLPPEARWRCSACGNRDRESIRMWHTGGSSSARIVSFPRGNMRLRGRS